MAIAERELTRIINPEPNRFGPVEAPLRVPKVEPIQEDPATRQRAEAAARAKANGRKTVRKHDFCACA